MLLTMFDASNTLLYNPISIDESKNTEQVIVNAPSYQQDRYEGTIIVGRYMWWVAKELNHENPNIDAYAKLLILEFARLENNEITIEEFDKNTPNIKYETPLNYMQRRVVFHYPN